MKKILLILFIFSTSAKAENHSAINWLSQPESDITVTVLDEPTAVLDEQIDDVSGLESCIFDAAMSYELKQNNDDLLKASKAIIIKEYLGWVKIYELIEADMVYDQNFFINGEGQYLDKKTFMPKEKNITRAKDAFTVLKRRYAHYLSLMLDNIDMGYEFSFDTFCISFLLDSFIFFQFERCSIKEPSSHSCFSTHIFQNICVEEVGLV